MRALGRGHLDTFAMLAVLAMAGCYSRSDELEAANAARLAGQNYSTRQGEANTVGMRREYFVQIGDSAAAAREGALLARREEEAAVARRDYDMAQARSRRVRAGAMKDENPLRRIFAWFEKDDSGK